MTGGDREDEDRSMVAGQPAQPAGGNGVLSSMEGRMGLETSPEKGEVRGGGSSFRVVSSSTGSENGEPMQQGNWVCTCVHACACVYECVWVCVLMCMHLHVCMCMCVYMCVCVCMCVYGYAPVCMHVCACGVCGMCVCVCMHVCWELMILKVEGEIFKLGS